MGVRDQRAQFSTIVTLLASGHWLRGACIQTWGCKLQGHWSFPEAAVPSAEGHTLWSPKSDRPLSGTDHQEGWPWSSRTRHWQKGPCPSEGLLSSQKTLKIMQEVQNPCVHFKTPKLSGHQGYAYPKSHQVSEGCHFKKAMCALLEVQWWTPWACLGQALGAGNRTDGPKAVLDFCCTSIATTGVMWSSRT